MIDVRSFCSEPGFRSAVLLTYSFDAVFFERVVQPDLRAGGTGTTVVLADRREVESAIPRWHGHVQQMGQRYLLDLASVRGSFHPKLILRVGPKGGAVWVGTGNVTPSGWGANRELATTWRVGPDSTDPGGWVAALLRQVVAWTEGELAREAIARICGEPWIQAAESSDRSAAPLWSSVDATLAQQVEKRWRGRRFKSVDVTTGSTDATGEFLRWAHQTFGVERARIAVHADSASFLPAAIERLPVRVEFVEPSGPKHLHAKSYWFDGPEGPAAIVGSANCSASAWLRPVASGGNIETVVVSDAPDRDAWRRVLAVHDGRAVGAGEHLLSVQREAEVVAEPAPYRLVGVELDGETRRLRARLAPQPPNGSRVSLLIDEESLPTKQVDGDASSWDAPPPEKWSSARGLFARARVETAGGAFETAARWIDDPAALRAAAQDRRVAVTLSRLLSAADANECRRIADDLQFAMDAIFSDRSAFADPPPARKSSTAPTAEEWREAPRLDPARLAVALGAPHSHASSHFLGQAGGALATGGVFDAMCPPDEDDVGPEDDATAGEEGESSSAPREPLDPTPAASRPAPPERLRLRVAKHMESYLTRLSASAFVSTCTATQLVNAVAFPIALAALGTRSGWADAANAQRWTVTAVTVLLHAPVEGAPDGGILRAVSDRYRADGRSDVFGRAVGNGLLWAATATVLASSEWSGAGGRIRRALLLRDIFRRDELTSSVDLEQLRVAARRFRGGDAVATMRDELPRVDASLEALEAWLAAGFEVAVKKQTASNCATEPGDPLWRPKAGWVFAAIGKSQTPDGKPLVDPWHPGQFIGRKSPIPISRGFYVNVRALLEDPAAAPLLP